MKKIGHIGLVVGLLLFVGLLAWQGVVDTFGLLLSTGWHLLWIPVVWLPNLIPAAQSWRLCFRSDHMPSLQHALMGIWLGRSVNNLLPVATIGGEIVKARLITLWGGDVNEASASVMIDKTVQAAAVLVWGLIGVALLLNLAIDDELVLFLSIGFGLLAVGITGLVVLQKAGMLSIMAKLGGAVIKSDGWQDVHQSAKKIDEIVREGYQNRGRFYLAVLIKAFGLAIQTAEVWLACYLLGYPISLTEAIMLKCLTATISDIAFVIPNSYGIQEGAFIMVGALLGMSPEMALAVSLAIRIRELIIDLPGLLFWHQLEAKQLMTRRST